ncbi:hypothetical protein LEP1GSC070_2498 [Leptospira santarosai str. AIM]|nr:hypothetical protein LEP1GSC070_2498 [Leptospira santarosai str. AIM]
MSSAIPQYAHFYRKNKTWEFPHFRIRWSFSRTFILNQEM